MRHDSLPAGSGGEGVLRRVMTGADRINQLVRRVPAWPVYLVGAALPVWLFWLATNGGLGPEPVKAIEHRLGLWGLQLIVAALCISPLRRFTNVNLCKYRRAVGLLAFFYILLHFLTWIVLDMGLRWEQALGDIVKRPYVTVGMVGFVAMIPPAVTSNDWIVRRLGPLRWKRIQKLVYISAVAGALHFVWVVKSWPMEPMVYLVGILGLLALRAIPKRSRVAA